MNYEKLIETTLQQLIQNTEQAFPDSERQDDAESQRATRMLLVPYQQGFMVKCTIHNANDQTNYDTNIYFEDISISDDPNEHDVQFMAPDGNEYSVVSSEVENADVKVRCTCLDFYWRFAMWNHNDGSLLGQKPKPYVKKTDREPNNPSQTPGVCKHLIATATHFMNNR